MGIFSILRRGVRRRPANPHTELLKEMNHFQRFHAEECRELSERIAKLSPEVAAECAKFLSVSRDESRINKVSYLDYALKSDESAELLLKAVLDHYPYLCEIGMEPPLAIMLGIFNTLERHGELAPHQQRALIRMESSRVISSDFGENFRVELKEYPEYLAELVVSSPHEVERIIDLIGRHPKVHRTYFEALVKGDGVLPLAAGEL